MKKISIVTPTFNEEENIKRLCSEIKVEVESLNYDYEHIIIDNSSSDKTPSSLPKIVPTRLPQFIQFILTLE